MKGICDKRCPEIIRLGTVKNFMAQALPSILLAKIDDIMFSVKKNITLRGAVRKILVLEKQANSK